MTKITDQDIPVCDSLTIRDVPALKELLLAKFRDFDDVLLDFPADAPADFAGVQLLDSAHRYAVENGKRFGLASPAGGPLGALLEQGGFTGGFMGGLLQARSAGPAILHAEAAPEDAFGAGQ